MGPVTGPKALAETGGLGEPRGMDTTYETQQLGVAESLALLRSAPVGRLAVIVGGSPEIFPVNHVVDHGTILFRTGKGVKLAAAVGRPVAYESDGYDARTGHVWSVMVTGTAVEVKSLDESLDAFRVSASPWEAGPKPHIIRILPDRITGRRFPPRAGVGPQADPDVAPAGRA